MKDNSLVDKGIRKKLIRNSKCYVNIFHKQNDYISGVHIHFCGALANFLDDEITTRVGFFSIIDTEGKVRKIPQVEFCESLSTRFEAARDSYIQTLIEFGELQPKFRDEELLVILKIAENKSNFSSTNHCKNAARFIEFIGLTQSERRCEVWPQKKQDYRTYEKSMDYTSLYIQPKPPINRLIEESVEKLIIYSTKPYELIG